MTDSAKNDVQQEPLTKDTQVEATITAIVSSTPKKLVVVPNWKKIFLTWSFWFHITSVLLTLVDQILPFVGLLEPTMTTQTYALVMFTLNALGVVSRFIRQKKLWTFDPETGDITVGDKPLGDKPDA